MTEAVRQHRPCAGVRLCRACAAAHCGVSIDVFDDEVRDDLPVVKIGARLGWLRQDLDAWINARRKAPTCHVQQNQRSSSAAGLTDTPSPSKATASVVPRGLEIAEGLSPASPRGGTKRTSAPTSPLHLVRGQGST